MPTPWKILALADREAELKPLRLALSQTKRELPLRLGRTVEDAVRELDTRRCAAVVITAHISRLHLAQVLAELRRREPLLPLILFAKAAELRTLIGIVTPGAIAAVIDAEFPELLAPAVEREIGRFLEARKHQQQHRHWQWLDQAMDSAPIGLAVADGHGLLRWANAAYRSATGQGAAEIDAGTARLWDGAEDRWPEVQRTVRDGSIWRGSVPAISGDTGGALHQLAISALARVNGEALYIISRQTAAPEDSPERLAAAQRHELFAAIAGGIAHDLNNILSPITMAASLLAEQDLPAENADLVHTIEQSAERGAAVIRQVLTFARGSANCEMALQPRYLLREVARLAAETFPATIGVRAELPASLWAIVGDPAEIHQAIVNVLLNARDAMPEGGHIAIAAQNRRVDAMPRSLFFNAVPGDYVEISIADDGPGLDPEVANRAWEPFVTTKGQGWGAGLGLSRVAGVLRSHGGFGQIASGVGQGTRVSLYFPRGAESVGTVEERREAPRQAGRILVVDDEEAILNLSKRVLERAGHEVLLASEGREALGHFMRQRTEISLVITDLAMPGMNGFTLIWALRRAKPDLRVLVATGQGTDANLRELELMGVREVLLKPFAPRLMLEAVDRALAEPAHCEPELFLGAAVANGA